MVNRQEGRGKKDDRKIHTTRGKERKHTDERQRCNTHETFSRQTDYRFDDTCMKNGRRAGQ